MLLKKTLFGESQPAIYQQQGTFKSLGQGFWETDGTQYRLQNCKQHYTSFIVNTVLVWDLSNSEEKKRYFKISRMWKI